MIRAIRPQAMAQHDAAMISGWNLSPNIAYTLQLNPGPYSCGVLLYSDDQMAIIASGAGLVGTDQPVILHAYAGQSIGMVDADLGWHLLLTTDGTESQRTIRIGPAVDLPDEIHPIYADDDLAVTRATAGVDDHAHYTDDISVACPLGFGAWIGDVASTPVDGEAIGGQAESITWTGTPKGASDAVIIRRHVAIAPAPHVDPVPVIPPTVIDDAGATDAATTTSGNVLTNDDPELTVVAVNGLSANVGVAVDGDNGGLFTVNVDGSWIFDPDGDFASLEGVETADTSVTYHASDGTAEAMATLAVTVSHANAAPVAVDDTGETTADATTSGNVLTNDTDADSDTLSVSKVNGSPGNVGVAVAGNNGGLFTIGSSGEWTFDATGMSIPSDPVLTTVAYTVTDGLSHADATLTVTVRAAISPPQDPYWQNVVLLIQPPFDAVDGSTNITDISGFAGGNSISRAGNTQVDTSRGYASVLLDGSGDYATITPRTYWYIDNAYTVEALVNVPSFKALAVIFSTRNTTGNYGWQFYLEAGFPAIYFWDNATGASFNLKANSSLIVNTDHHIEMSISDDKTVRLFIDGILVGKSTAAFWPTPYATTPYIWRDRNNAARDFIGLCRIKITDGIARHTTDAPYQPPTAFLTS